ncbi:hypothetical protein GCM10027068_28940 [Prescottella soli]
MVVALVLGSGFGAVTSVMNEVASPMGAIGSRIAGTGWASTAEVTTLLLDAGWAWAALAVVAGALTGVRMSGAAAGALALISATTVYYLSDSILREEPLALYGPELVQWSIAAAVLGLPLGAVGASINDAGVIGLLAGLTVPVGAAVQMLVLPPSTGASAANPAAAWAQGIVFAAAAVAAAVVTARFVADSRRRRRAEAVDAVVS